MVDAAFGKFDRRHRIPDRTPQAVSQQVGRTHPVHELLVDDPTALLSERLGFEQHFSGTSPGQRAKAQD